jgi:hypothetical protein
MPNKRIKPDSASRPIFCKIHGAKKRPTCSAVYAKRYTTKGLSMKILGAILLAIGLLASGNAAAGKMMFGDQDSLHKIQDVEFNGPNGEELYLAYRTTIKFFILGVNITKQGYVLAIKDSEDKAYYSLDNAQIKELQNNGGLPNPMPKYKLTKFDYAFGYSLWILILIFGGFSLIKRQFKKRKKASESEEHVV